MIENFEFVCGIANNERLEAAVKAADARLITAEAVFSVTADGEIYFKNECFNFLEFIIELKKPMEALDSLTSFDFESVDHDEPIFSFKKAEQGMWEISSIWSAVQNEKLCVGADCLIAAFDGLVGSVNEQLIKLYGISLEELITKARLNPSGIRTHMVFER